MEKPSCVRLLPKLKAVGTIDREGVVDPPPVSVGHPITASAATTTPAFTAAIMNRVISNSSMEACKPPNYVS